MRRNAYAVHSRISSSHAQHACIPNPLNATGLLSNRGKERDVHAGRMSMRSLTHQRFVIRCGSIVETAIHHESTTQINAAIRSFLYKDPMLPAGSVLVCGPPDVHIPPPRSALGVTVTSARPRWRPTQLHISAPIALTSTHHSHHRCQPGLSRQPGKEGRTQTPAVQGSARCRTTLTCWLHGFCVGAYAC